MQYVLLGDIKGSRNLPVNRVYTALNKLCQKINQKFDLAVPMVITLGDEWQMVCKSRTQCLEVLEFTKKQLGPIEFRAVIGSYSPLTHHIGSLSKFNGYMKRNCVNPLIGPEFKKVHDQLSEKIDGIVILT